MMVKSAKSYPAGRGADSLLKDVVEVKDAGHRGLGVYATEICCWYDGVQVNTEAEALIVSGKRGFTQNLPNGKVIAGFPAQFRGGGCSQMINDWSTTYRQSEAESPYADLRRGMDLANIRQNQYSRHINVATITNHPEFKGTPVSVAIKRIKKGDQLFSSYGEEYWNGERAGNNLHGSTDPNPAKAYVINGSRMAGEDEDKIMCLVKLLDLDNHSLDAIRCRYGIYHTLIESVGL